MRFIDYFLLSFRNIRQQKVRSLLTILAIVIGATGITVMLTLVTSVKSYTLAQFTQSGQNLQISVSQRTDLSYSQFGNGGQGGGLSSSQSNVVLTDATVAQVKAIAHVAAVAPVLDGFGNQAFTSLSLASKKLQIASTYAYDPNGVIRPAIVAGRGLVESDGVGSILLTQDYADALGFKGNYGQLVGQTLMFQTTAMYTGEGAVLPATGPTCNQSGPGGNGSPGQGGPGNGSPGPGGPGPGGPGGNGSPGQGGPGQGGSPSQTCGQPTTQVAQIAAKVIGVASDQNQSQTIFFPLVWALGINDRATWQGGPTGHGSWTRPTPAQALTSCGNTPGCGGYRSLVVKVDATENVNAVAKQIRTLGVGAATAQSAISQQIRAFNILGYVLGAVGMIALLIAALGVINTMVMAVLERTREIGVMRAVGAKRATIRRIFTMEAAALGFCGGIIGVIAGYALVLAANPFINKQIAAGSGSAKNIIAVPPWLVLAVICGTTAIGVGSGLLPARRAARLDPVEALRYE